MQRLASDAISFRLVHGRVRDFTIPWVAACTSLNHSRAVAPVIETTQITSDLRVRAGRFSADASYVMSPGPQQLAGVSLILHGRIRGTRATGTLRAYAELSYPAHGGDLFSGLPLDECGTGPAVRWSARAR